MVRDSLASEIPPTEGKPARRGLDLQRRAKYLTSIRGSDFARRYVESLLERLRKIARRGRPARHRARPDPALRTFGYEARPRSRLFAEGELEIVRVYFTGQDWTRGPRRR